MGRNMCIDCIDIPWNLVYFVHNVSTASTCVLLNVVFICIQCIDCFDIPWNLVIFVHNVSTASTCVLLNVVFILHTMYRLL